MKNGNDCHRITLQQHYSGNFPSFYFHAQLCSTLMKTFSDSWHALVTNVTTNAFVIPVLSIKYVVLTFTGGFVISGQIDDTKVRWCLCIVEANKRVIGTTLCNTGSLLKY